MYKTWIPPEDFLYRRTYLWEADTLHKWWIGMYHAVIMLGINEVFPSGTVHVAFNVILQVVSAIILAIAFGLIALLITNLNGKQRRFEE